MILYVDISACAGGDGSERRPFCRITDAARIAMPGDTVLVAPGIYRESVVPIHVHAGTERERIEYRSVEPLGAVITGAEPLSGWTRYQGNVWTASVPNSQFGAYNPYTDLFTETGFSESQFIIPARCI